MVSPRPSGDVTALRVTALGTDGTGLARHQGRAIAVPGTLPGERVEVLIPGGAGRAARAGEPSRSPAARLVRVVQASPARVVPRCRHADVCGGCGWQHIAYAEQRRLKRARLQQLLDESLGDAAPHVAAMLAPEGGSDDAVPPPWGFRHKVHFACAPGSGGRPLTVGHYGTGTQEVVAVEECPVHAEAGNRAAWAVRSACERLQVPGATADGRRGLLRHVVVRVGRAAGECLVTLVVTDARDRRLARLAGAIAEGPQPPAGLHVNVLEGPGSWLFGPETRRVGGRAFLREEVAGTAFLVSPTGFFQTNVAAAEVLVKLVLEAIPRDVTDVLDLYAGAGLFALPLARRGHRVVAVEEHLAAVEAGRGSRRLNGLDERTCRFLRSRVEDALETVRRAPRQAVVLDPPRAGCPPRVLRRLIGHVRPDVLVYVSCEPSALARDLALLLDTSRRLGVGYRIDCVQPVDMFPHTPHIEAVAVLSRQPVPDGGGGQRRPARRGGRRR